LNVLKHRLAQIVNRSLSNRDGAFDLSRRKKPAQQQISQVSQAHHENAVHCRLRRGEGSEVTVDPNLDELRPQQLG